MTDEQQIIRRIEFQIDTIDFTISNLNKVRNDLLIKLEKIECQKE